MRIISQDGSMDIAYDMVVITTSVALEQYYIYVNSKILLAGPCLFAKYSTREKYEQAMEMLRNAYDGGCVMKNIEPTEEAINLLREWNKNALVLKTNKPNESDIYMVGGESYFRFPADDI